MRFPMLVGTAALLLTSCTVESRLEVYASGEAKVTTRIVLQPAFIAYWNDLKQADPTLPPSPMDAILWRRTLGQQAELIPPRFTQPVVSGNSPDVTLSFGLPDINTALGSQSLGRLSQTGGKTQLVLTLDRKTLKTLFSLTTIGNSSAVPQLIPAEKAKVTESDYAQLLAYLLEPYDPKSAALLALCKVELKLELPAVPSVVEGASSVAGKVITARWSLARVLSLETPITLRAVY